MKQDLEPGPGSGDTERRRTTGAAARPRGVYAAALACVVVLVAVGMAGVLAMGADEAGRTTPAPVASAEPTVVPDTAVSSPEPQHVVLADVAAVDLRTGKASALPRSIRKILGAGHFRVSNDGRKIAFDDDEAIFVARIDGTHLRRYEPELGVSAPSWSPDASRLVFSEGNMVFLLDLGSGRTHLLVQERRAVWAPNFSPDGRTILYTTVRARVLTLRTIPAIGGRSSFLQRGAFGAYAPDGTTIAYRKTSYDGIDATKMTSAGLWLADSDGSHRREIGFSGGWMSQVDPEALWPMWSPDGTLIAFRSTIRSVVRVLDIDLDRGVEVGEGGDPSWLDAHTLIIPDFKEVRP